MNLSGLSFDNIPSFQTPMRFFITAPVFSTLGAIVLCLPNIWLSRWQPDLIALTHVFTLGFILMIMCGALTQVLPVLSGRGFPYVDHSATVFHALLTTGLVLFPINFLYPSKVIVLLTTCLIAIPLLLMVSGIVTVFFNSKSNVSIFSIKLAGLCLVGTVLTGLWQLGSYHWLEISSVGKVLTNIHFVFGLLGWVSLTIIGVSFQVIPMFHVTPEFPDWLKRGLPMFHFLALLMLAAGLINEHRPFIWAAFFFLHLSLVGYAGTALYLLTQRRRKVADTTINFWRLGLIMLLLSILVFDLSFVVESSVEPYMHILALLMFVFGFVVSIILGMLLKIVPFLAFLNLQQLAMKSMDTISMMPSMSEFISAKQGRLLFYGYLVLLPVLVSAPLGTMVSRIAGAILLLISAFLLILNVKVWQRFKLKHRAIQDIQFNNMKV
ncbi:hypothetical protein [Litoribrevibacter albus]|uniref:Uncharacterized protein n=1 Tax=Litoribrevibacter albus TaxID=1473156 RepID=A0AA37S9S4_9GAMM|nr:hypothetical protein [Litoribrevibacter albus]GLQ31942.1 hypothetical protein GCM10007876_24210 [Litoribrevibacter albus]